jgi:hypothetical protein
LVLGGPATTTSRAIAATTRSTADGDTIEGAAGNDRINVVAGGFDRVSCGDGQDVVFADVSDQVNGNCEDVRL